MAPPLSPIQHVQIRHMMSDSPFNDVEIARIAKCTHRAVRRIRSKLRRPGPSPARHGRSKINPAMLKALQAKLARDADMYQEEMVDFLWEAFEVPVSRQTVGNALKEAKWSNKTIRRVARERNQSLRDFYWYKMAKYKSYQLVFVDESGCDRHDRFRRRGWAPRGSPATKTSDFHRDPRYQILPAYAQDGIMLARVYQGSTDAAFFQDFISQLLRHCGRFLAPKSVLVMDNASIHRGAELREMCSAAGVELVYLPPYSPDFNPIEEWFGRLKTTVKKHYHEYDDYPHQDFARFLKWCISVVGQQKGLAEGHFRHAGIRIEQMQSAI